MSKLVSGEGLQCEIHVPSTEAYQRLISEYRFPGNRGMYLAPHNVYFETLFLSFSEKREYAQNLLVKYNEILKHSSPRLDLERWYYDDLTTAYRSCLLDEFKTSPINVTLSSYDLVPKDFDSYSNNEKMAYLIQRQHYATLTIKEIHRFYDSFSLGGIYSTNESFFCTMTGKQRAFLFRKLVEFNCLEKDIIISSYEEDDDLDKLSSSSRLHTFLCVNVFERGPSEEIYWKRKTGMFAYLMDQLYQFDYIRNPNWQAVVHNNAPVISNLGNRLTYSNLSSSLYAYKRTKKPSKSRREVDKIILHLRLYEGGVRDKKH